MIKRIFDLLLSFLILLITLPFYPFIGLAIKLDSKGPIFYTQPRVGRDCSTFKIIKFRTMVIDHQFNSSITIKNDPRITSLGKFLRRYKIDEWPTLLNVIKSEMSVVGPRPEAPKYVASWPYCLLRIPGLLLWSQLMTLRKNMLMVQPLQYLLQKKLLRLYLLLKKYHQA